LAAAWQVLTGRGQALQHAWQRWRAPRPLGERGERAAERFLKRLGYQIVARQDRSPLGEMDLIAVDRRVVVFCEVKTRTTHQKGHPSEAVDADKQLRMSRWALGFIHRHGLQNFSSRFDVIAVTWPEGVKRPTIEHYKNAFEAVGPQGFFS
jgi:putative endonuclease